MSDNLKLAQQNIDIAIDPAGAIGSILASNHNAVLKEVLAKSGRYTGLPFTAQDEPNVGGVVPVGTFVWNSNLFNDVGSFQITLNKQTADLNDIGIILNTINNGATIRFKDYVGRSVYLEYVSHVFTDDGNGNDIYNVTVKGKAENINYAYQPGEKEPCIIEFYLNALSLPNAPGNQGDLLVHNSGGFGVVTGLNYNAGTGIKDSTLNIPAILTTRSALFGTPNETVDFEGGDLVGTGFTTNGDQDWFVDILTSIEGVYSVRAGAIIGNQSSTLYKTVTLTDVDNAISFGVFADTELNGDELDFYINKAQLSGLLVVGEFYEITDFQAGDDFTNVGASSNANGVRFSATGTTPTTWTNSSTLVIDNFVQNWSGSVPWETVTFPVVAGTYQLKWVYTKDNSVSTGADTVRIDFFETAEIFRSSSFNGFNSFNDINVFSGQIEFRDKILGSFKTVNDIIVNGLKFGTGNSNINSNILIDGAVNQSGQFLTILSKTNTVIGANSFKNARNAKNNSGYGSNVMRDIEDGEYHVGMGTTTLRGLKDGIGVIGFGRTVVDLQFDLTNYFFVNDGVGDRMLTISKEFGANLPMQTNDLIDAAPAVDPTAPPPTEALDDVYYLDPEIVGAVHGDWDGGIKGTSVIYDGANWVFTDALGGKGILTREYFQANLPGGGGAVPDAPVFSVGNSTPLISVVIPTGDPSQPTTDSGDLIVARNYITKTFIAGDDFTNVADIGAAANVTGAQWTCIATTPTTWTNLTEIIRVSDIGYRMQITMLEANEDQKANNVIAYKDISDSAQTKFLDESVGKFMFPSNLFTFGNTYVNYILRSVCFVDLSAIPNATTKYYIRLRRASNDTIVAQDEFVHTDFVARDGAEITSEIITFVEGESDPFVVDGCYLDMINDENSSGTVTLRSVAPIVFGI